MLSANHGYPRQRNLIFEGNSLFNGAADGSENGHYITKSLYDNFKASYNIAMYDYSVFGRTNTLIFSEITTHINPLLKKNDVIVYWEGTNDMKVNSLTGTQSFANLVSYLTVVNTTGAKIIVCTVIARDYQGVNPDPAALMDTYIPQYNTLVRNNAATYGYTVCDLAADPKFDQRADANNATYYRASDATHLVQAGSDAVIALINTTLTTVLAQ